MMTRMTTTTMMMMMIYLFMPLIFFETERKVQNCALYKKMCCTKCVTHSADEYGFYCKFD